MRKLFKLMLTALLLSLSMTLAYAHSSSDDRFKPKQYVAMKQEPTTVSDSHVKPKKIANSIYDYLSCPAGYALTSVAATAETAETVKVYGECNGFAVAGYVHAWCKNAPTNYRAIKYMPTSTYTCKKIVNTWKPV